MSSTFNVSNEEMQKFYFTFDDSNPCVSKTKIFDGRWHVLKVKITEAAANAVFNPDIHYEINDFKDGTGVLRTKYMYQKNGKTLERTNRHVVFPGKSKKDYGVSLKDMQLRVKDHSNAASRKFVVTNLSSGQ